jgi:hypothetical protein
MFFNGKKKNTTCFFLLDHLLHEKRLSEAKAKEKFRQLVLAVEYIHSKNIVNKLRIFFFIEKYFLLGSSYVYNQ